MTTGKTVQHIYDSISCSTICWLFTMRCIFFYLSGCSFVWSYKTFQRINFVQPDEHHSSGLLKMKNFVSDFLIASRRHGACYDSILFSTVCWLLTMRYFILIYPDAAWIGVIRHFGESILSSWIKTTVWIFED